MGIGGYSDKSSGSGMCWASKDYLRKNYRDHTPDLIRIVSGTQRIFSFKSSSETSFLDNYQFFISISLYKKSKNLCLWLSLQSFVLPVIIIITIFCNLPSAC